jgi:hypothetical protein
LYAANTSPVEALPYIDTSIFIPVITEQIIDIAGKKYKLTPV